MLYITKTIILRKGKWIKFVSQFFWNSIIKFVSKYLVKSIIKNTILSSLSKFSLKNSHKNNKKKEMNKKWSDFNQHISS